MHEHHEDDPQVLRGYRAMALSWVDGMATGVWATLTREMGMDDEQATLVTRRITTEILNEMEPEEILARVTATMARTDDMKGTA